MTKAIAIAAGAGMILVYAGLMLLVVPSIQLSGAKPPAEAQTQHSAEEIRGRKLYVSLGCVYCHSQQPRDPAQTPADRERGWGRPSVPEDYTYDGPHLLGTMRTGPDLFNIGARQPSVDWHLAHLYNPRAVVSWSTMPSYPFLFRETDIVLDEMQEVHLPEEFLPSEGHIVATDDAMALVKYMLSLDHTYPVEKLTAEEPEEEADEAETETSSLDATGEGSAS
ncbi:MAG TPA: cbb3-type cytochrome c oxidase subunit II [Salinisphaeraceae bacterium]|nr:cbb3-type cytochrome c oxidase subunit II [Salinisphaeraceae bacterium]